MGASEARGEVEHTAPVVLQRGRTRGRRHAFLLLLLLPFLLLLVLVLLPASSLLSLSLLSYAAGPIKAHDRTALLR